MFTESFLAADHRDYVIISSIDWSENWQIHQMLATSLVESGHRVLFVENTGVRGPRMGDIGRIGDRVRNWIKSTRGFCDVRENLTVFSPIFLPFPYSRLILIFNRFLLTRKIIKWIKIRRFNDPVLITFLPTPLAQALIEDIDPSLIIYYCADDMAGGSTGAAKLRAYEDRFFTKADAVFCTSHALAERAKPFAKQIYLFPAGVDFNKFEHARSNIEPLIELANIARPIVGYIGSIRAFFDLELLLHTAKSLPEVSFVLVGPVTIDVSLLAASANIKMLGKCQHDKVPSFINEFAVAIIPFEKNQFTDAVYSCKLNEYLAMGTQVVATNMRELEIFADCYKGVLAIAKDKNEFVDKIRQALIAPDEVNRSARISAARANSWEQRFEDMGGVISRLLQEKSVETQNWQDRLTGLYRRGRMKIFKACLIFVTCYLAFFYTPILWLAGDMLVMRDKPSVADSIVVFSGDGDPEYVNMSYQKRAQDALVLYRANYSSRIILSSGKGQTISEAEVIRALLLEQGVPSSAIKIIESIPRSTFENVQLTSSELRLEGNHKVLFVTAPRHSFRAHLVWKKLAPDLDVITVGVIDTPSEQPRWQTSYKVAKVIVFEYLAIAYYWWNGWV